MIIFLTREEITPGVKFFESEVKGIPFRIELGMRDLGRGEFTLFERDINNKTSYPISLLTEEITLNKVIIDLKINMHNRMLKKAESFNQRHTFNGEKLSVFGPQLMEDNGFCISHWCGRDAERFKLFQASVRCVLEFEVKNAVCCLHEGCIEIKMKIIIARNY